MSSWGTDRCYDVLNRAGLAFAELCGHEDYLRWLDQERSRVRIRLGLVRGEAAPETPAPSAMVEAADADQANQLAEALEYYADPSRYARVGRAQPEILNDGGKVARDGLAAYSGEANGGGE